MDAHQPSAQELFTKLMDTYSGRVYRASYRILRDIQLAEDVVQEVFGIAWSKGWHLQMDACTNEAEGTLVRTSVNCSRNCLRRHGTAYRVGGVGWGYDEERDRLPDAEANDLLPDDKAVLQEEIDQVQKALAKLNSIDQEILRLLYSSDLTLKEIGVELKMPPSTVRSRHDRALEKLRNLMDGNLDQTREASHADSPDAVLLGEFEGQPVHKHPPPGSGKQPFITWNGHTDCFAGGKPKAKGDNLGAGFTEMNLNNAIALLRRRGRVD